MRKVKVFCFLSTYGWEPTHHLFLWLIGLVKKLECNKDTLNYYLHTAKVFPYLEEPVNEMPVTEASNKYEMKSLCSGTQNSRYTHFLYISKIMLIVK